MNGKDAGFTLIELMATLAIVAVILALGAPSLSDALQRQRVSTTLHLLSADMAMARNTAVMRHSHVIVCPRKATGNCAPDQEWGQGWMVFNDPDGNRQPDAETDILRVTDAPGGALLLLPSSRPLLRYQADGRAANSNLTVYVCDDKRYAGKVIVNNLGRVRTELAGAMQSDCPRS